jgi:hypothetical protein
VLPLQSRPVRGPVHALAALFLWTGTAALAQTERPWVDPPPTQAGDPPRPGGGIAEPPATPATRPAAPAPAPEARVPATTSVPPLRPKQATPVPERPPPARTVRRPPPAPPEGGPATAAPPAAERAAKAARPAPVRVATPTPSFNCRYARTPVERAICADPVLAAKDRRMALLYERAGGSRYRPVDPTQWRWLSARNACAPAGGPALEACIDRAYEARIAELSGRR